MKKISTFLLSLYYEPLFPFALVLAGCFAVAVVGAWITAHAPPESQRIYVPYQWVCHSKYRGGDCVRTGGYDRDGHPWGTAVPRP